MEERKLIKTAAGNYTAASVKNYVKQLKELFDRDFSEQRERLVALRDENRRIKEELLAYRQREHAICEAVVAAEETAQHIVEDARAEARRTAAEAAEFEKHVKEMVQGYMERLFDIEKHIAALLGEVIAAAASLKDEPQPEESQSAAGMYRLLNSLRQNGPGDALAG